MNKHTLVDITAALSKALQDVWGDNAADIGSIAVSQAYNDIVVEVYARQQGVRLVYPAPYLLHSPDINMRMQFTAREILTRCTTP